MLHPLSVTTVTTVTSFRDIPPMLRKRKSEAENLGSFVFFCSLAVGIIKRVVTVVTTVTEAKQGIYMEVLGEEIEL